MAFVDMQWRPQGDGSLRQWVNCSLVAAGRVWKQVFDSWGKKPTTNLTSWSSTISRQTDGTGWNSKRPTMAEAMRNWLESHYGLTAGVTIPKAFEAAKALWGAITGSGYRWNENFDTLVAYVSAGRPVHTIVDYGVTAGTGVCASPSFAAGTTVASRRHSIAIAAKGIRLHKWTDSAGVAHSRWELRVHDGLAGHNFSWQPQGWQWWPLSMVKKGAGSSIGVAGNCEFGFGADIAA